MPPFQPIKQRELIKSLKKAGFEGPYSGGKHPFMVKGDLVLTIPNTHKSDIGRELLARILKQAGMTREEWEMRLAFFGSYSGAFVSSTDILQNNLLRPALEMARVL